MRILPCCLDKIPRIERSNLYRPYGTRIYFPLYPALRLRLRVGLNYFAPTALDFRPPYFTGNSQVSFSHTLKACSTRTSRIHQSWDRSRDISVIGAHAFADHASSSRSMAAI